MYEHRMEEMTPFEKPRDLKTPYQSEKPSKPHSPALYTKAGYVESPLGKEMDKERKQGITFPNTRILTSKSLFTVG